MHGQVNVERQTKVLHDLGYIDALKAFIRHTVNDTDESCLFRPVQALCLGLGPLNNPDHDRSASQLVAFQAFLEAWSIPPERVKMHDPRFTDEDKLYLSSLGYQLAKSPEDAMEDLICAAPTFAFTPYLPYPVIELLFERNWSPDRLSNLVIIGTPLEGWLDDDNWFREEKKAYIPRIRKSIPLFDVRELPRISNNSEQHYTRHQRFGIEDLKLQWIPPKRLASIGERFWHIRGKEESIWAVGQSGDTKKKPRAKL